MDGKKKMFASGSTLGKVKLKKVGGSSAAKMDKTKTSGLKIKGGFKMMGNDKGGRKK